MGIQRVWRIVALTGLLGASCAPDTNAVTASTSVDAPQAATSTVVDVVDDEAEEPSSTGQCGQDLPPDAAPPATQALRVEVTGPVGRGDRVAFRWDVDPELEVTTGDETTIECWTGDGWVQAWASVDLFGERGGPFAIELSDNLVFTADGFANTEGMIAISESAPDGSYRIWAGVGLCEPDTGDCTNVHGEARFVVQGVSDQAASPPPAVGSADKYWSSVANTLSLASYDTAYATVLEALPNVTYTQPDGTTFRVADIAVIGQVITVPFFSTERADGPRTFQIDVDVIEVISADTDAAVPIAEIARFVVTTDSGVTVQDARAALLNGARVFVLGSSGGIKGGIQTWDVSFRGGFWFELNDGIVESPALLPANREQFIPEGLTIDEIRAFAATPVKLLPQYDRPDPSTD